MTYRIASSIPVLRMSDEAASRRFYVDLLGFDVQWEHRFSETSPLYMQIRLGNAVIHLNGHEDASAVPAVIRIPIDGIEAFCDVLRSRHDRPDEIVIADPRGKGIGTDLNLVDPDGNLIVFSREGG